VEMEVRMRPGSRMATVFAVSGLAFSLAGRAAWTLPRTAADPGRGSCSCTPMAPLELELTPLPRRKKEPKEQQRLRVRVTPQVDALRLEVTVTLPPGVTLLAGETRWQAAARAGESQSRELLLRVPAAGEQRVVASARLIFRRSLPLARAASHTFHQKAARSRPEAEAERPGPIKEPPSLPVIPLPARGR
jgi:hypothetical protein